jgi:hypothetical protein
LRGDVDRRLAVRSNIAPAAYHLAGGFLLIVMIRFSTEI